MLGVLGGVTSASADPADNASASTVTLTQDEARVLAY